MRTIAKWFPNLDDISYERYGTELNEEFHKNPYRVLIRPSAITIRRLTPKLTKKGKESFAEIKQALVDGGYQGPFYRKWNSPGYRILSSEERKTRESYTVLFEDDVQVELIE